MKTFDQLNPEEQQRAVETVLVMIVRAITNKGITFNDEENGTDLQARIEKCFDANRMAVLGPQTRTPAPTLPDRILSACGQELIGMAKGEAAQAIYTEPGERVVEWIIRKPQAEEQKH